MQSGCLDPARSKSAKLRDDCGNLCRATGLMVGVGVLWNAPRPLIRGDGCGGAMLGEQGAIIMSGAADTKLPLRDDLGWLLVLVAAELCCSGSVEMEMLLPLAGRTTDGGLPLCRLLMAAS